VFWYTKKAAVWMDL